MEVEAVNDSLLDAIFVSIDKYLLCHLTGVQQCPAAPANLCTAANTWVGTTCPPNPNTCVQLPAGTTNIASQAFLNCDNVISVLIPTTVTTITGDAFHSASKLKAVVVPSSVTTIGYYAFHYCSSLQYVSLPTTITVLDDYVFSFNFLLACINIPSSVTTIKSGAFINAQALTTVNIPNSVTQIGGTTVNGGAGLAYGVAGNNGAFQGTAALKCITGNANALQLVKNAGGAAGLTLC